MQNSEGTNNRIKFRGSIRSGIIYKWLQIGVYAHWFYHHGLMNDCASGINKRIFVNETSIATTSVSRNLIHWYTSLTANRVT